MSEDFAFLISSAQQRLYAYIYSLVGVSSASWDVLQETNLVLWRKREEYRMGTAFDSWAFTVARFQVLAYLRDRKRDPFCVMTPELLDAMAEEAEKEVSSMPERLLALRKCREQLGAKSRRLLIMHYDEGKSLKQVGETVGLSVGAMKQALFRIRRALLDCMETQIKEPER